MSNTKTPRGLRNNNPLNIRRSADKWQGLAAQQTDKAFFQFRTLAYGFRAAFKTIRTYMTKYGCRNVTQIIMRWAPPSENDTSAYVRKVCQISKLSPVEPLDSENPQQMHRLVQAMAYVENGVIIEGDSIRQGWQMAAP